MKIFVDIGNTNAKWMAQCDGPMQLPSSGIVPSSEVERLVLAWSLLQQKTGESIDSVIISNVKGDDARARLESWVAQKLAAKTYFAEVERDLNGVRAAYENLTQLGVDRWLGLIASHNKFVDCNKVVVSSGSAITADFLGHDGEHLGGLIAPGVDMMRASLSHATSGVKTNVEYALSDWVVGKSTQQCVSSGIAVMVSGFCDEILAHALDSLPAFSGELPTMFIVTGGGGVEMASLLKQKIAKCHKKSQRYTVRVAQNLVLDGLKIWSHA